LNLSEIAVGEFANFEIDRDIALEDGVIENEIDIKVVAI
jgi:hypothetical protein